MLPLKLTLISNLNSYLPIQPVHSEGCFLSAWIVFLFFLCKANHKVYLGSKALKSENLWRFGHTTTLYNIFSEISQLFCWPQQICSRIS